MFVYISQVNIFNCGGIGLLTSLTHKIADGHSYFTFMRAWASVTRGLSTISPSFVASKIFPGVTSLEHFMPSKFLSTKLLSTKRFVFDSKALGSLQAQSIASTTKDGPTRTEATSSLFWKAAAKAASTVRPFGLESPHALFSIVNLRKKASPPFPNESFGNIIDVAPGICFPKKEPNLSTLMGEVRESIAKIDSDYIESRKGEKGQKIYIEKWRKMNDEANVMDVSDCLIVTCVLHNGMYEIDFGWGKPIWFYVMNPGNTSFICLNDVIKGGGVEAIVTLSSQEMEIFERDSEILSYATLNPSPLQFLK